MIAALRKREPERDGLRREAVDFAYDNNRNLGDALNVPVLEYLGAKFRHVAYGEAQMVGIGSILSRITSRGGEAAPRSFFEYIDIWGSGFVEDSGDDAERFIKNVRIHALRGEYSRRRCEQILGEALTGVPLGDPGLLASRVFRADGVSKKHDVGVIPHYVDKGSPLLGNIRLSRRGIKVIDIQRDPGDVVKDIVECRVILSSAMHGLIVADSYGIPNRWIQFSDGIFGAGYKFMDYYSALGVRDASPIDLRNETIDDDAVDRIESEYPDRTDQIARICDELCRAFPRKRAVALPMKSVEDVWLALSLSEVDKYSLAPRSAKPALDELSRSVDFVLGLYDERRSRLPRADASWDGKRSVYRVGGAEWPLVVPRMIVDRCERGWAGRDGVVYAGPRTARIERALGGWAGGRAEVLFDEARPRSAVAAWDEERYGRILSAEFALCPHPGYPRIRAFVEAVMCGAIPIVGEDSPAFAGFTYLMMSGPSSSLEYDEGAARGNLSLLRERFCLPGAAA